MPAVSAPGTPTLVVVAEAGVSSHPLPLSGALTIGRGTECDVSIDHPSISRRHAVLHVGPPLAIEDLGSANGTRVRGAAVPSGGRVAVAPGEVIELGGILVVVQGRAAPRALRLEPLGVLHAQIEEDCAAGRPLALLLLGLEAPEGRDAVEDVLASTLGPGDRAASAGDDEYAVLVRDATALDARDLVARLYDALCARAASARIGLAVHPDDGTSVATLEARALAGIRASRHSIAIAGDPLAQVRRLVERVAPSAISVLVLGETGVGKEVMARTIHALSGRGARPFVGLNCAALSGALLESELFGHERGAFTGATQTKPGLLETAAGGTVFLDEVGELPADVQVKLLRVLEERAVLRVGGLEPRPIDVRIVSATNRDLEAEIERGTFRRDLYFRLAGVSVVLPPLRLRVGEIESLARGFAKEAAERALRAHPPVLSPDALALLESYHWPGNVRELRNLIERAVVLCRGDTIRPVHLPLDALLASMSTSRGVTSPGPEPEAPAAAPGDDDAERRRILAALEACAGNQSRAARQLGISRNTLLARLDRYGIARPRKGRS